MKGAKIVSREEWVKARKALLRKEKDLARRRDALNRERRKLPWVRVEKRYSFTGANGRKSLAGLFGRNSQLVVYHFMLAPDGTEGCPGCSFMADHLEGANRHLPHRDVTLVAVSRAPLPKIQAYKKRMGWTFPWFSSHGGDFNDDYESSAAASEYDGEDIPGLSAFYKNDRDDVFHTYSSHARGLDAFLTAYQILDAAPKGRNETGRDGKLAHWVRRHDKYRPG